MIGMAIIINVSEHSIPEQLLGETSEADVVIPVVSTGHSIIPVSSHGPRTEETSSVLSIVVSHTKV